MTFERFVIVDLEQSGGARVADGREFNMIGDSADLSSAKHQAFLLSKNRQHRCAVVDWENGEIVHEIDARTVQS